MSNEMLVQGLLNPAAWPHATDPVELLETHISWVLLTGDYAYKIKKPLRLEFLDFSTLDLRRKWCEEELRLNSRWAPGLYLDVVPITGSVYQPQVGGDGTPIEYAVRMHQFPQEDLLSAELDRGKLGPDDMRDLAEMIADRHASAPVNREERFGDLAAIRKPMVENFIYLEPWLDGAELGFFRAWTDEELGRHAALIDERRQGGFVRRVHGDLHLRNLVRFDGGIVAFDCIEFSEELRTLDVISDLTFLSMDLIAAGRDDLAWTLLNRYLEVSGDYEGMRLYGLYHVYHCMIRAKVAAIMASERDSDETRRSDLDAMHHYCAVARHWIEHANPALVVMHGLSGSGKTWVSSQLVEALGAVRARSDIERKRMHGFAERASSGSAPGEGLYGAAKSGKTYARLNAIAAGLLAAGHRVILDATYLHTDERLAARRTAGELGAPFVLVAVEAPAHLRAAWLETRQSRSADASEANRDVLEFQRTHADPLDDAREGPVVHFVNGKAADIGRLVDSIETVFAGKQT